MKKIFYVLAVCCTVLLASCKKEGTDPTPQGKTFPQSVLISAINDFYTTWESERDIPATVKVGDQSLAIGEFIYAEAATLKALAAGTAGDITVISVKNPANPDRDSYENAEIAVKNGPKDGKNVAEDLVSVSDNIMSASSSKGVVPNQTNFYRGSDPVAFSTNRATVTIARAIAGFASTGSFAEKVSTDYLSAGVTLKAFATEFVKYLDVWENNIAEVLDSDGKHCTVNNNPWEFVHFVPIPQDTPYSAWTSLIGKNQFDPKYQPYFTITVNGVEYTAANCWEIAIRGLMDMCSAEGNTYIDNMKNRNTVFTPANGKALTAAPICRPNENCKWGQYPWYEADDDNTTLSYNNEKMETINLYILLRACTVHVARAFYNNLGSALGMIGNFQQFGETESLIKEDGYLGLISPMHEFIVLARVYKYILDNNINSNVYDALKDVQFSFDCYNQQQAPVALSVKKLSFESTSSSQDLTVTTTGAWTSEADEWITVNPASGSAGEQTVTVTVQQNTENTSRNGSVKFTCNGYTKSLTVSQAAYVAPTTATIGDFINAYVGLLDVWSSTRGTLPGGEENHTRNTDLVDINYIPLDAKITVAGVQYDSPNALEIAMRCYLLLMGLDGNDLTTVGAGKFGSVTPATFATAMPTPHGYGVVWWYLDDKNNGGPLRYKGEANKVTTAWITNYVERNVNFAPVKNNGNWGNLAGYNGGQLADYTGTGIPPRCQMALLRMYKMLLDNQVTGDFATYLGGKIIDSTLYGNENYD